MADIRLLNVTKQFGSVLAIDDITLEVHSGELVALLGPSGCGKTTTMRSIAGLERPERGDIFIGNRAMKGVAIHKREVGMVFQDYALFPHLTIQENIAFGLKMRKIPARLAQGKIDEVLKLTRLAELPGIGERYPHQLSGGQRQRVALARALVTEPKVLLLDEPFGALDKKLRERLQVELRLLQQQLGITTVFVTHDQEEALTLADRIAVMRGGRIEQIGAPSEIYEAPRSRFVADFIGVSNFFEGQVERAGNGALRVHTARGMAMSIKSPAGRDIQAGDTLQLALRPEKVSLAASERKRKPDAHAATIQHIVYLGTATHYYVNTESGEDIIAYVQNQDMTHGRHQFQIGDAVSLSWKPENVLVLEDA